MFKLQTNDTFLRLIENLNETQLEVMMIKIFSIIFCALITLVILPQVTKASPISKTIEDGCNVRTANSKPGDLVYYWWDNTGSLRFHSIPLNSKNNHPFPEYNHYNVQTFAEIGFCFVPYLASHENESYSAMVIKEALVSSQTINNNVYLTIGDAVQSKPYSWFVWQKLGTETSSSEVRGLNVLLRSISFDNEKSLIDYRDNLIFSNDFEGEKIKRTVDVVRWKNTSSVETIKWYHSPRVRKNRFKIKILEIFVVQKLAPNEAPRTVVITMHATQKRD